MTGIPPLIPAASRGTLSVSRRVVTADSGPPDPEGLRCASRPFHDTLEEGVAPGSSSVGCVEANEASYTILKISGFSVPVERAANSPWAENSEMRGDYQ